MLNIVDENDHLIGVEDRSVIHEKGLLHREIHVYFVTPDRKIIFQHRAKDKDTYPDLLDATVGGHVEIGDDYLQTAVKETFEETGVTIAPEDLITMDKIHMTSCDPATNKINHAFQQEFVYLFKGNIDDLKIEIGNGLGFESRALDELLSISDADKAKFIPYIYKFVSVILAEYIKNNL